ncbi:MAG: 50S ribosomal protein L29 [Armatimonadetes bacterium]|nr:50S ribosomal protein L29 [Armatimonadota bacterium]
MRRSEFRKKIKEASDTELETMLKQEREGLYKLRQQIALKQLDNPHAITNARKNIARILTAMSERKAGIGKGS